ncbi:MAG: Ig-like domain-containing protein, partial [Planctomycetota bacterium]|nr:Ig-like domain-containing protein [Planctomycetota bacterium]
PGDVINQPGVFAQVTKPAAPQSGGTATNVEVRLLAWPTVWDSPGLDGPLEWITSAVGPAQFLSAFDPSADSGAASCFISVFPAAPDNNSPTTNVAPSALYTIRFSEPMDPVSVTAFDAYTLTREATPTASYEYVVGTVNSSQDVQEFTFIPDLPLAHATAAAEDYFLTLMAPSLSAAGSTDLAGNSLSQALPQVTILLDPTAGPQRNGGRVSRFSSKDEEAPFGNANTGPIPEWGGQISFNYNATIGAGRETISPRGVSRFQAYADRQNMMISSMGSTAFGPNFVQSPLSNYGSKTQALWRFLDLGLDLYDINLSQGANMFDQYFSTFNLDVEGMNWSPVGAQVLVDNFPDFEMRLSHGLYTPDEVFPTTGLVDIYDNNQLDATGDPPVIVHPKVSGYTLSPGEMYMSPNSVPLMPYPLNRNGDPSTYKYYTYRDTAITTRGGPNGWGMYPQQWHNLMTLGLPYMGCLGTPPPPQQSPWPYYLPDNVQSIALPLLMEFRCWAAPGAQGINRFDTVEAVAGSAPYFRAWSTGGIDEAQNIVTVDPGLEVRANGGFNPGSTPPGGAQPGLDGEVYIGAIDFVVRVSRAVSVWFPATDPDNPTGAPFLADYSQYVLEPPIQSQPLGTSITASFRGAGNIVAGTDPIEDALTLDLYGDHYLEAITDCFPDTLEYPAIQHNNDPLQLNTQVAFYNSDTSWFDDPSSIDGASYYQIRLSFMSNTETGLSPELSAFALTWSQ